MKKFIVSITFSLLCICVFGQVSLTANSGTASGSYSTLKDAFDAINNGTHQGDIIIQISNNTTETASAVLNSTNSGSAIYNSVLIYPTVSGKSITGNINAPLIDLNGADHVVFDGRVNATGTSVDLTLSNTSTNGTGSSTSTIRFIGDASNNSIKYLK